MPAGLADAHTGVGADQRAVSTDGHGAGRFPAARVVVEGHEHGLLARRQHHAVAVRHVGETGRHRAVEVLAAVGLHRDVEHMVQAVRQWLRQARWIDNGDADLPAPLAVVVKQGIGRHEHLHTRQQGVGSHHPGRQAHRRVLNQADGAQRARRHQRQIDDSARHLIVGAPPGCLPRLADIGIIRTRRPLAERRRATVHVNEEPARRAVRQREAAGRTPARRSWGCPRARARRSG